MTSPRIASSRPTPSRIALNTTLDTRRVHLAKGLVDLIKLPLTKDLAKKGGTCMKKGGLPSTSLNIIIHLHAFGVEGHAI